MVVTASMGRWQLGRAAQKIELQSAMQQRAAQPAWDNAQWRQALRSAQQTPASLLHQPVQLRGRWLAQRTVYLDNRQMHGQPGFYVLTPLQLDGGGAVLVQRGWVARNFQDRTALPAVQTPAGTVQVQGRVANPPSALYALGQDAKPDAVNARIRQNIHIAAFSEEIGLPLPALSVVQTDPASDGLQRDWPVPDAGVAKHHGYAAQWFGLCALVAGLYLWFHILRPPRRAVSAS